MVQLSTASTGGSRSGRRLFRAMRRSPDDGSPDLRDLGVRYDLENPGRVRDVYPDPEGCVGPGGGGMSVTPDDPRDMHFSLRPRSLGGSGRKPVWELNLDDLPSGLRYRQDKPGHGVIEPDSRVTLAVYVESLAATADLWKFSDE